MLRGFYQELGSGEAEEGPVHLTSAYGLQPGFLLFRSETGSHPPSQVGLELSLLLPQPPKRWIAGVG